MDMNNNMQFMGIVKGNRLHVLSLKSESGESAGLIVNALLPRPLSRRTCLFDRF